MKFILLLHSLLEGGIGLLLLIYAGSTAWLPGFAHGSGSSYQLVVHMYGLAALLLAAISTYLWYRADDLPWPAGVFLLQLLIAFHAGMALIQFLDNPDARVGVLHLLLVVLLGSVLGRIQGWREG